MSEGGDKTEEPSQKKLDDARKEGNVWKSRDLSGMVAFGVAMGVVKAGWSGSRILTGAVSSVTRDASETGYGANWRAP